MELVTDYEALTGSHNETVIKEIALLADNVLQRLHFLAQYDMRPYGSAENGFNWNDAYIPYHQFQMNVKETVAGYACLYSYVIEKCRKIPN